MRNRLERARILARKEIGLLDDYDLHLAANPSDVKHRVKEVLGRLSPTASHSRTRPAILRDRSNDQHFRESLGGVHGDDFRRSGGADGEHDKSREQPAGHWEPRNDSALHRDLGKEPDISWQTQKEVDMQWKERHGTSGQWSLRKEPIVQWESRKEPAIKRDSRKEVTLPRETKPINRQPYPILEPASILRSRSSSPVGRTFVNSKVKGKAPFQSEFPRNHEFKTKTGLKWRDNKAEDMSAARRLEESDNVLRLKWEKSLLVGQQQQLAHKMKKRLRSAPVKERRGVSSQSATALRNKLDKRVEESRAPSPVAALNLRHLANVKDAIDLQTESHRQLVEEMNSRRNAELRQRKAVETVHGEMAEFVGVMESTVVNKMESLLQEAEVTLRTVTERIESQFENLLAESRRNREAEAQEPVGISVGADGVAVPIHDRDFKASSEVVEPVGTEAGASETGPDVDENPIFIYRKPDRFGSEAEATMSEAQPPELSTAEGPPDESLLALKLPKSMISSIESRRGVFLRFTLESNGFGADGNFDETLDYDSAMAIQS
ncbi:hypothetical protein HK101_009824 [Irineochytrium annulatum]|nr:hypothetical protein HK101_009824 [Irineochytrium annulatum]